MRALRKSSAKEPSTVPQTTSESSSVSNPRRQFLRNVAFGGAALTLTGWAMKELLMKDVSESPNDAAPGIDIDAILENNFRILDRDLEVGWRESDRGLRRTFSEMERNLRHAGTRFANEKITRLNIMRLLSEMARDHFDNGNRADVWFEQNLTPHIGPPLVRYDNNVAAQRERFESRVAGAIGDFTHRVAYEVSQVNVEAGATPSPDELLRRMRAPFERRGIQIGASMVGGASAIAVGTGMYSIGRIMRNVSQTLRQAIFRVLRPVAIRSAGRLAVAGPASAIPPLGAIIAVGGSIWTGIDVYRLRGQTQQAFFQGLDGSIQFAKRHLNTEVALPMRATLQKVQENRGEIKREIAMAIL